MRPFSLPTSMSRPPLLSGQNVCWPCRMLPPGESRWVCAARCIKVTKKTWQKQRRMDVRPSYYTYSLTWHA